MYQDSFQRFIGEREEQLGKCRRLVDIQVNAHALAIVYARVYAYVLLVWDHTSF